jgi:hypothetical protein
MNQNDGCDKKTEDENSCKCSDDLSAGFPMADQNSSSCECSDSLNHGLPSDDDNEPCCGPPPGPKSDPFEKPGYKLCDFVDGFEETEAGMVPRVKTSLGKTDIAGTIMARANINRNDYKVTPGLYCVGIPGEDSPVLVTANYKLSFDALRKELTSINAWILVLDTRGINVWCAAGKKTFSTQEVIRQVQLTGIAKLVKKKELILPQLSATGVCAIDVKKACGFKVVWGPVRAGDFKKFLASGKKATPEMRQVTFFFLERVVLIPVEISLALKPLLWIFLGIFILSGIGPEIFSFSAAWTRSFLVMAAFIIGIAAGAVAVPALLPWIPGTSFSAKGALAGLVAGVLTTLIYMDRATGAELVAAFLCTVSVSSYLAMNFTGTTPFTSPSGVEKEMRRAIPIQAGAILIACVLWVGSAF